MTSNLHNALQWENLINKLEARIENAGLNFNLLVAWVGGLASYVWLSGEIPDFLSQTLPRTNYTIGDLYLAAFGPYIVNILLTLGVLSGAALPYIVFRTLVSVFRIIFPEVSTISLAPPKQVIYRLPNWPEASVPKFVLGEEHEPDGTFSYTPRWNVIPQKGLVAGLIIFGAPGAAKTTSVILPFIEQMMEYQPRDRDLKVAMFIVDRKGNLANKVQKLAARYGRADDVVVIRLGGPKLNLLSNVLPPASLAAALVASNTLRHTQSISDEPEWIKSGIYRIFYHAIAIFRWAYGDITLKDLNNLLSGPLRADAPPDDPSAIPKILANELDRYQHAFHTRLNRGDFNDPMIAKTDFAFHQQYFEQQLVRMNHRNKATLIDAALDLVEPFASPELSATFCPTVSDYSGMSTLMQNGHIVIFEADERMGRTASTITVLLKLEFQRAGLARIRASEMGEPNNRLWAVVIDEYQTVATIGEEVGDDVFVGLCRESRIAAIFATQSPAALQARIGEARLRTLFGAIRTKIFLTLTDPTDGKLASSIAGENYQHIQSTTFSESNNAAMLSLITDTLQAGTTTVSEQCNFSEQLRPSFLPIHFQNLNTFEAIACVFDGERQRPPVKIYLKPIFFPRELPFNQYSKDTTS